MKNEFEVIITMLKAFKNLAEISYKGSKAQGNDELNANYSRGQMDLLEALINDLTGMHEKHFAKADEKTELKNFQN